ncbi:MAG: TetR/AcrR family transcriptional regulator [Sphingobium sp.]
MPEDGVSRNLYGQRLGRKGRDTRDRIVAAAQALLAVPEPTPITLSAVAREASLGMTTLYLYFSDLTELLLAVLEPVMATAEESYLTPIRSRWPDDGLNRYCYDFILAYHAFWLRHARILHLRNAMADHHDQRMMFHRVNTATMLIGLVVRQMDADPEDPEASAMATVLISGIERVVTMATDVEVQYILGAGRAVPDPKERLRASARLLELGITEHRAGR